MNEFDDMPTPAEQERLAAKPPSPMQAEFPAAAEHSQKHSRRVFLFKLSLALNAVVGVVLGIPILGYLLGPMFRKDSSFLSWVPLVAVDAMPVGATRLEQYINPVGSPTDGVTQKIPCWTRRTGENSYTVFAINCAHLGCPVRWFEQSQLFLCPCHGGTYYADGQVASGPPPRGLFEYPVRIVNGTVYINAGEMPTLSNRACSEGQRRDLIQIQSQSAAQAERTNA